MQGTDALVFDFDGVLVESTEVKTQAFGVIYREYGEDVAARAVDYHIEHAGISRFIKFRHLHSTLLGITLSDAEAVKLGERFSALVVEAVVAASWVAGAKEFLEAYHRSLPLFVASGTPDDELNTIIARRGMRDYFRSVHGTPATKGEIISGIVRRHGYAPGRVLVLGDAHADLDGARHCGARFVGRVHGGPNPFPAGTVTLPDLVMLPGLLAG